MTTAPDDMPAGTEPNAADPQAAPAVTDQAVFRPGALRAEQAQALRARCAGRQAQHLPEDVDAALAQCVQRAADQGLSLREQDGAIIVSASTLQQLVPEIDESSCRFKLQTFCNNSRVSAIFIPPAEGADYASGPSGLGRDWIAEGSLSVGGCGSPRFSFGPWCCRWRLWPWHARQRCDRPPGRCR